MKEIVVNNLFFVSNANLILFWYYRRMNEISLKQKCISTIVTISDGRLDYLSIGDLHRLVNRLLSGGSIYDIIEEFETVNTISDIVYVYDIIKELVEIENEPYVKNNSKA